MALRPMVEPVLLPLRKEAKAQGMKAKNMPVKTMLQWKRAPQAGWEVKDADAGGHVTQYMAEMPRGKEKAGVHRPAPLVHIEAVQARRILLVQWCPLRLFKKCMPGDLSASCSYGIDNHT